MRNKSIDQQSILQEYNKFKQNYRESEPSIDDVNTVLQSKKLEPVSLNSPAECY